MNLPPTVKYTLGRIGLFLLVFAALLFVPGLNLFLKLMIAILASFGLQFVLLGRWRREMIGYIDGAAAKSKEDKARLRAALAGEDEPPADQPPTGQRPTGEPPSDQQPTGQPPADPAADARAAGRPAGRRRP